MATKWTMIDVDQRGDVFCVRLRYPKMSELELHELGEELGRLVTEDGCRKLCLALGYDQLDCLYSVFIGQLIGVRRLLVEHGGRMKLCEVGPASLGVLKTCKLVELFDIHPDVDSTVRALQAAG
ncbi:MAG: hypothetical protein ACJ8F7_08890 [Gemmataceae bacterium]